MIIDTLPYTGPSPEIVNLPHVVREVPNWGGTEVFTKVKKHKKLLNNLRARLQGLAFNEEKYYKTLRILNFTELMHTGIRKDDSPEFSHQCSIALLAMTFLPSLISPARTLNAILLHDTAEDYNVPFAEIEEQFGSGTAHDVKLLTKEYMGERIPDTSYFEGLSMSHVTSVVKLLDRIHNLSTMKGAFSLEKQKKYVQETEEFFLPFAKEARRRFPEQELIYEQCKFMINTMLSLYKSAHSHGIAL